MLERGTLDVREPGYGEVQVEIVAAGLNRADILQRRGMYPAPPGSPPDVPGLEFSGKIVARGPNANLWKDGDAVMAIVGGGAMARRITLHERELMPVPKGVALEDAAAIPEVFLTAWDAMRQANLRTGETLLVHAAASGVGTAAIQLARALGARVLGTSRRKEKLDRVIELELGLEEEGAIVAGDPPTFANAVNQHGGAHVIIDTVGASYFEENLRAAALGGRVVLLATAGGATAKAPLGMMLGKRLTVIGTTMRARPLEQKMAIARAAAAELVPLFERVLVRPVIDRVFSFDELAQAHARMEADENVGKIILRWS